MSDPHNDKMHKRSSFFSRLRPALGALIGGLVLTLTFMVGSASASSKKEDAPKTRTTTSERAKFLAEEKAATEALMREMFGAKAETTAPTKAAPAQQKKAAPQVQKEVAKPQPTAQNSGHSSARVVPAEQVETFAKPTPAGQEALDAFVAAEVAKAKEAYAKPTESYETVKQTVNLEKAEKQKDKKSIHWAVRGTYRADTSNKKGDSDANGDFKDASATMYRIDEDKNREIHVGVKSGIHTTQSDNATRTTTDKGLSTGRQFDTASTILYGGFGSLPGEEEWNITGRLGVANGGPFSTAMRDLMDRVHKGNGIKNPRHSPFSSGQWLVAGVEGNYDRQLWIKELFGSNTHFVGRGGVGLTVGSDVVGGKASLTVGLTNAKNGVLSTSGVPYLNHLEWALYAQGSVGAKAWDRASDRQGTYPLSATVKGGVMLGLFDGLTLDAYYERQFLQEIAKRNNPPVSAMGLGISYKF